MRVGSSRGIKPRDRAEGSSREAERNAERNARRIGKRIDKRNAGSARAAKLTNRSKPIGGTGQSL